MTNPFDIQDAAFAHRAQILKDAETWRMLRVARRQGAGRAHGALGLAIRRLFRIRATMPDPAGRPARAGE